MHAPSPHGAAGAAASNPTRPGLSEAIPLIWLVGAGAMIMRLWMANSRLARLLRNCREVQDGQILGVLDECARLVGIKRLPALVLSGELGSPALIGCFRPKLVLPENLASVLSHAELRHVFLHELAHVRRRDLFLNWLLCCLAALHWFNPILRYAFRRIKTDRELACDAFALSRLHPQEAPGYGRTVLKLLESVTRAAATPGVVGLLEEKQQMKRRIEMIAQKPSRKNPAVAVALFAALGVFTLTDAQTAAPKKAAPPAEATASAVVTTAPANTNQYNPSADKGESAACRKNLEKISAAIKAYKKDHNEVPNWLHDLVPKYLADTNVLVCPVTTRTGQQSPYGVLDPTLFTSYVYEFTPTPIPEIVKNAFPGPAMTMRQWKEQQMKLVGADVPLVRCILHDPVLNLSFGGKVYESPVYWEMNYTNVTSLESLYPH